MSPQIKVEEGEQQQEWNILHVLHANTWNDREDNQKNDE